MDRRGFVTSALIAAGYSVQKAFALPRPPSSLSIDGGAPVTTPVVPGGAPTPGLNGSLNGVSVLAPSSEWYRDISGLPADPNSTTQINTNISANGQFKLEGLGWSSGGSRAGIPYVVVDSATQALVPVVIGAYPGESTLCWAPIPARDDIIESYPAVPAFPAAPANADNHVVVVDRASKFIFELNGAYRRANDWYCRSLTVFDMNLGDGQVPAGWTSGDVAGCSILAGLVRGEEVSAGVINHAIRTTVSSNPGYFTKPATHGAYNVDLPNFIPLGARLRLRADYPETGNFPGTTTPITALHAIFIRAMKKYGILNADANGVGASMWSQGDTSPMFADYASTLIQLQSIKGSDMTIVQSPNPTYLYSTRIGPVLSKPTAGLTANVSEITAGGSVTLAPSFSNSVRQTIGPTPGPIRTTSAVTVSPAQDTWYTLQAVNGTADGAAYAHKRILVTNWSHRYSSYDFYVSPTGSMTNNGTQASPFSLALFQGNYDYLLRGMVIGLLDGTYDVSSLSGSDVLLSLPGGVPGRPTVLQAVNSRRAIISGGSKSLPVLGRNYGYCSHIQLIGLKVTTAAAPFCTYWYGVNDTGIMHDDCEFSGFSAAGIRFGGSYSPSFEQNFVRACLANGAAGTSLARVSDSRGLLLRGNSVSGGATVWNDSGNNSGTVVD